MQDTLDITGAVCEYDFTLSCTLETGYSVFVQWKDTTQVYNIICLNFLLTKLLTINVDSAMLPTQLPVYQGKCWQRSYQQCTWQWLT